MALLFGPSVLPPERGAARFVSTMFLVVLPHGDEGLPLVLIHVQKGDLLARLAGQLDREPLPPRRRVVHQRIVVPGCQLPRVRTVADENARRGPLAPIEDRDGLLMRVVSAAVRAARHNPAGVWSQLVVSVEAVVLSHYVGSSVFVAAWARRHA